MNNEGMARFFNSVQPHIKGNPNLCDPQVEGWFRTRQHFLKSKDHTILQIPVGCGKTGKLLMVPPRRRFHGTVTLNPARLIKDASQIVDEVLRHITQLPGADVTLHLEIDANNPDCIPEDKVRTLGDNCKTLNNWSGFEDKKDANHIEFCVDMKQTIIIQREIS